VTLTYNLYFAKGTEALPQLPHSVSAESFKSEFSSLLADPNFLPSGGHLGFGLRYQYPIPTKTEIILIPNLHFGVGVFPLTGLLDNLKGSDATLFRVCRELGLVISLRVVYESSLALIMLRIAPDLSYMGEIHSTTRVLTKTYGGKIIKMFDEEDEDQNYTVDMDVQWVTPMTEFTRSKTDYVAYGNEADLSTSYGNVVALVSVGPPGERDKPKNDEEFEYTLASSED